MLKDGDLILVVTIVFVLMVWGPKIFAQETEDLKTYLNPEYKFTIQYPGSYFGVESVDEYNRTSFELKGYNMELYLTIESLNKTMIDSDAALIYIENTYNDLIKSPGISSIQNITEVKYGGQQAYKTILDAGGGAVYGYATIQHGDAVLFFYMFNNDRANYQGILFDQIVNSTKFFD